MISIKTIQCRHCSAVNKHHSFQCHTQRKPIKRKEVTAKPAPRHPIKKVSDKRKKEDNKYSKLSKGFKTLNPNCMAKLDGCTRVTSDVHHLYSGCHRSKYYLDITTWVTVCPSCHHLIHDVMGKDELIELGLKRIE